MSTNWGRREGDFAWSLLRCPGTELFESVEFYLDDGLEMVIHQ